MKRKKKKKKKKKHNSVASFSPAFSFRTICEWTACVHSISLFCVRVCVCFLILSFHYYYFHSPELLTCATIKSMFKNSCWNFSMKISTSDEWTMLMTATLFVPYVQMKSAAIRHSFWSLDFHMTKRSEWRWWKKRCSLCSLLVTLIISCCIVMSVHSWMMPQCNLCMNGVFCAWVFRYSAYIFDVSVRTWWWYVAQFIRRINKPKMKPFFFSFQNFKRKLSILLFLLRDNSKYTHTQSFTVDSYQNWWQLCYVIWLLNHVQVYARVKWLECFPTKPKKNHKKWKYIKNFYRARNWRMRPKRVATSTSVPCSRVCDKPDGNRVDVLEELVAVPWDLMPNCSGRLDLLNWMAVVATRLLPQQLLLPHDAMQKTVILMNLWSWNEKKENH